MKKHTPLVANEQRLSIAVVIDREAEYGRGVIRGIMKYARPAKTWIVNIARLSIKTAMGMLRTNPSVIIVQVINKSMLRVLNETGIPYIDIAGVVNTNFTHQVCMDNVKVGKMAAEHFIEKGFKNFAYLGGLKTEFAILREKGYRQTLLERGHKDYNSFYMKMEPTSYPSNSLGEKKSALCRWLQSLPIPTAIFACNDGFAIQVSESCQQVGLGVPEDMAILGVDNDEQICLLEYPPLSSIILPEENIGFQAAKMADSIIQKIPGYTKTLHLHPQGIALRQSSDIVAITDKVLSEVLRFIRENAAKPITVEDVSVKLMISRRLLEKRTIKLLGHTPLELIRLAHINLAQKYLAETDMPMSAVAAASGFSNQAMLSVTFRRYTGKSPSNYRQQFRNS
jgi:LacI family transcriptional regulator